ncbi:MAG: extensin family protein [Acidothermales bacterium]|nr:extensin family protein [Acidothermales bacterium]
MGCCDSEAQAKVFDKLAGVPTFYIRNASGERERYTFKCNEYLFNRLHNWVERLNYVSKQYGPSGSDLKSGVTALTFGGIYVCRMVDPCATAHGYGRAADLDEVKWGDNGWCKPYDQDHVHPNRDRRRRYLAVDATCRQYFRYVVDGYYNAAHHDHIHMDNTALPTKLREGSTADTVFIQKCCNDFMGYSLKVDGDWGTATQSAYKESKERLNVDTDPKNSETAYRAWLYRAAAHGFADLAFGKISFTSTSIDSSIGPPDPLPNLYEDGAL